MTMVQPTTQTIHARDMAAALDGRDGVETLSLDCFDTLLWRDTHAPTGVFDGLSALSTGQRVRAEARARKIRYAASGQTEIGIGQIYAEALPNAAPAERQAAIADELAAEARSCFAFAPTVALMRAARERGLGVVLVSDTYLDESQLRGLIAASAGADIAASIDRIFCSSTYGVSKAQGLFAHVLKDLDCRPETILHIGDNRTADHDAARALRIPALHMQQFEPRQRRQLRQERAMAAMVGPVAMEGATTRFAQPHRAALAARSGDTTPAFRLGHDVLGPIFLAYDRWLDGQAKALAARHGGTVHRLFMMRDGHLPLMVRRRRAGPDEETLHCHAAHMSRFAATAASLAEKGAIERHVAAELGLNPATLARQLLFDEAEIARLVDPRDWESSSRRLLAETRKGAVRKRLRARARAHAERLVAHIRALADPRPGDVLLLADLGYNGSVQNAIAGLLSRELGVHVAGRYLVARETVASGLDKAGLIDARMHDERLVEALCANIAVIEQLSTCAGGSVTGYREDGAPILSAPSIKGAQSAIREEVQQGCLSFCDPAAPVRLRPDHAGADADWRDAACAALARFAFLPHAEELDVIRSFEHDVNQGSERTVTLFDPEAAEAGMKRRGLLYMQGSTRMFLPAELAGEALETRLASFAHLRFGLDLVSDDDERPGVRLPVMYLDGAQATTAHLCAAPTHDGWQVLRVPVGQGKFTVAVQFGEALEWLQIDSVTCAAVEALDGSDTAADRHVAPLLDDMEQTAPHLFHCTSPTGLMLISPAPGDGAGPGAGIGAQMIEIVFRPIAERVPSTAAAQATLAEQAA